MSNLEVREDLHATTKVIIDLTLCLTTYQYFPHLMYDLGEIPYKRRTHNAVGLLRVQRTPVHANLYHSYQQTLNYILRTYG